MLRYKIDCINLIKEKNKLYMFGGADLDKMRKKIVIGINTLNKLCKILELQPGDIIEYVEEEEN